MSSCKNKLLLSTALIVPLFFPFQVSGETYTVNEKKIISTIPGLEYLNVIMDTRTYSFADVDDGTWGVVNYNGSSGSVGYISGMAGDVVPYGTNSTTAMTLPLGIYQNGRHGIYITATDPNNRPIFDFTSGHGTIWDYSAYILALPNGVSVVLSNGAIADNNQLTGDVNISNGIFKGKIDIRKGNAQDIYKTDTTIHTDSGDIHSYNEYQVESTGDIKITGGDFYFSQNNSQILMYEKNEGDIYIRGGNWYVGYSDENTTVGGVINATVENLSNGGVITITGGKYHIAEGATLLFAAPIQDQNGKGSLSNPNSTFQIDGRGTLAFAFTRFDIDTNVIWETGTIKQIGGILNINSAVYLDTYRSEAGVDPNKLIIKGILSIKNNLDLYASDLSGSGELILSEAANARMGTLSNFGTLSLKKGMLTFAQGGSEELSLSVLNGAVGMPGQQVGIISVNARTLVKTVNLGSAALLLNEQFIVDTLNFDNGQIIFTASDKPLTLVNSTTILNTANIVTGDGTTPIELHYNKREIVEGVEQEVEKTLSVTPVSGTLTIKDKMVLTFADSDDPDMADLHFNSPYLSINVETSAKSVFNANQVSFAKLLLTEGTAEVQSGNVFVSDEITVGNKGKLKIVGGTMSSPDGVLTAELGSEINIQETGTLSVGTLKVRGSLAGWGTVTGAGTLEVLDSAEFYGHIVDLGNLILNSGNATFDNQTGSADTIGKMTVENGGKADLTHGTLTLDSLTLDGGEIELSGDDSLLALKQDPSQDEGISGGEGNSIHGIGTLELLNNTSITFGGGSAGSVGYLGGLNVGTGTATIEAADDNTILGRITFTSSTGGTLQINEGAVLVIADEVTPEHLDLTCERLGANNCKITTMSGNKVQGDGTLRLVDGDGSVFGGLVNLDTLQLDKNGVTVSFEYTGTSTIKNLTAGAFNLIVDKGTLVIENDFGTNNTLVSGTGTLFLKGASSSIKTGTDTDALAHLVIGTGTVNVYGGEFSTIAFNENTIGTLHLKDDVTVTKSISVNAASDEEHNTITADTGKTLTLYGAVGSFFTDLSGIGGLVLDDYGSFNRTVAYINKSTQIGGSGLILHKGRVEIASGVELKIINTDLGDEVAEGASPVSLITGAGTLNLFGANQTINSSLTGLNTLKTTLVNESVIANEAEITNVIVDSEAKLSFSKRAVLTNVEVNGTLELNGNNSVISGNTVISGVLKVNDATRVNTVSFNAAGAKLNIKENKTLSVFNNISVGENNILEGTGTLFLAEHASGTFAMFQNFDGTIKIGSAASALIQTDATIGAIQFENTLGGTLNIASGYTLSVGSISTGGENKITGAGSLKLTGHEETSVFGAPVDDLGTLVITNGAIARFDNPNRNITVSCLTFDEGAGSINIAGGTTITITELLQYDPLVTGSVYGDGAMIAGTGTVALSTGGVNQKLAYATIGTGTLNFIGDSHVGTLQYSSANGVINISEGTTVQVDSSFSGIGILTGAETAKLQLTGQADAVFYKAIEYQGSISAETGTLRFLSDTDFKGLTLNGTTAKFERETTINNLTMSTGDVEFRLAANVNNLTISSAGSVLFKDTANLGMMNVGPGTVKFRADSTASGGSVAAGGTLDIDVNKLTINTGNFVFNNNSTFSMRISRTATDEYGNVNNSGFGRIVMNGGTMNIGSNVTLDMTIDYGLKTAPGGSVFKLVEGNQYNEFVFSNNRYTLEKATCEGGLCYRLIQSSTAGEYAQEESGNQNQVNTAAAFLDGDLFEYGTKAFEVAEHLDTISQNGVSREFLNALTALAPDVTGGMSQQPIVLQSKISNTLSGRMNGISGNLGSSSRTYRDIQRMYGRSGGSPYRTRFMRSSDYYRRAGYYDQYNQPTPKPRPAYRRPVLPNSAEEAETIAEHKRWAKRRTAYNAPKEFGAWGQMFHNMSDYLSSNKPDGFSGKTTGYAFGADVQLFDVFAVGLGYASTSSSVDSLQRKTDVDGTSLFLYGMYKPSDWFISSVLNSSSMTYKEVKDVAGISLKDNYKGSSLGLSVMLGKEQETWTPSVGLRYVSSSRKAHTDEIGQRISGISTSVTTLVAEGRMNRELSKTDTYIWHSDLAAAITYDISAASEDAVVNLPNGSHYTVKGEDFSTMGVELGGTLSWLYGEHVDISAGYNLEWRKDYLSHTLTATFRYTF